MWGGCALPLGLPTPLLGLALISPGSSGSAAFSLDFGVVYLESGSSSDESNRSLGSDSPDEVVSCLPPEDRYCTVASLSYSGDAERL